MSHVLLWLQNGVPLVARFSRRKTSHGPEDRAMDCSLLSRRVKKMPLINLVLALIVVGVALWLINRFIPMASSIKTILNVVVVVSVGIWVLKAVGLWGQMGSYHMSR